MSKLSTLPALNGAAKSWDGLKVAELTQFELVSLSAAQGKQAAFRKHFKFHLETDLPEPGQVLPAKDGSVMWLEPDTYLYMAGIENERIDEQLARQFKGAAYTVLQSDSWACLQMSGGKVHDILERLVSLDMRAAPPDFATRTSAHHTPLIIVTLLDGSYLLFTPRSYAKSFLDGLIETIENVAALRG